MGQTRRHETAAVIERERISAIIRTNDQGVAGEAMRAAVDGGFRIVEFTLTTPGAFELIAEFSRRSDLLVGAGTVLTVDQARKAVAAGARFLVSPICDPIIVAEAAALDVASIPGAFTPTEMQTAHRLGADFVKVFPAPAGGVGFIEAVRGPLPHLRLFPTAGVTTENFVEFLNVGCAGVGFVKSLFEPSELSDSTVARERRGEHLVRIADFAAVRKRATEITRRLAEWRASAPTPLSVGASDHCV